MTTGTAWFQSRRAAIRYYARQGLRPTDVNAKIEAGEIHIGPPPRLPGFTISILRDEGRYAYVERAFDHDLATD